MRSGARLWTPNGSVRHNSSVMSSRALRRRSTYRALGRHDQHRSRPWLKLVIVLLVGITMLTSGASAATIFFYGQNLPTLGNFKHAFQFQNTLIRDRNGKPIYDLADLSTTNRGRRVVEPLTAPGNPSAFYQQQHQYWLTGSDRPGIPVVFQDATIATEDATFYSNPGFDAFSIMRAIYQNFTQGHVVSGASTITQQLVRAYMLNGFESQRTLSRKATEILLAGELTQKYPKSQILWYYLNSVPYGNLAIGAQAAAQQYFHTDVWKLNLAQSALLAGLPEAPTTYDPVNNLPVAKERMNYVLKLMCQHGYLDANTDPNCANLIAATMAQARTWKFHPAQTLKKYPHFVQYAINQLQNIPQLQDKIYNGLDVYTTLDPALQDAAQLTVQNQITQLGPYNVSDGALVSIDTRPNCYGCVLAMVGSANYDNTKISGQINMADSPRQPGSSFKPFNYVYAFQNGVGPGTTVLDAPLAIPDVGNPADGGWYEPLDYDKQWHGTVTLRTALDNSLNVPAVKVEQYGASVGGSVYGTVAQQAYNQGITSLFKDNTHCCGWALTLGGMERGVRLVQETSAYGAFASGGITVPPVAIWKVYDRTTHKLLYYAPRDEPVKPRRVIQPAYAYLMNNVLSDNASRCTPQVCEFGLDSPLNVGRTAAAKTGTTTGFTDNWTVGYTPDIVTGVWVGNADNSPMVNSTGITGAAPIWHDFMLKAFDLLHLPPKDFTEPPDVYAGSACRQNSAYYSPGSTVYDVYAGIVPICSVGTYNTTVPIPQQGLSPYSQQPATAQPTAAPIATQAPVATAAPPTPIPQQPPPSNGSTGQTTGGVTQPIQPQPTAVQPAVPGATAVP